MKVIQSLEYIYEEQLEINKKLKVKVDEQFNRFKKNTWHYLSRIKQLESFALKLETGRFSNAGNLEDFFACTLVVENLDQINNASSLIKDNFTILSKRPGNSKLTHKHASSFQFDDLRIYATLKNAAYLPKEQLSSITFEIQIKTFLQHAWALATHDLIYKTDEINWSKERIAYQIKAMLEQAELTISGVNNLINLPEVLKENKETKQQNAILKFYLNSFLKKDLPKDLVRLCKNTYELIIALDLKPSDLTTILADETEVGRGTNYKNLSPFLLIIQSVINQRGQLIQSYINQTNSGNKIFKILLPKELQINQLKIESEENIIRL